MIAFADTLRYSVVTGDASLWQNSLCSRDGSIDCRGATTRRKIGAAVRRACTVRVGNIIAAQFRKALMFIMKMGMAQTISWQILRWLSVESMPGNIRWNGLRGVNSSRRVLWRVQGQQSGMLHQKVSRGILRMASVLGSIAYGISLNVRSVVTSSLRRILIRPGFVISTAKWQRLGGGRGFHSPPPADERKGIRL